MARYENDLTEEFVCRANLERFEALLAVSSDDGKQERLRALVAEERAKLRALEVNGVGARRKSP